VKPDATVRDNSRLFGIVTAIFVIATLYLARVVFIPLALALLLTILLTPVVVFLERIKLPRIVAIILVVAFLFSVIGLLGWKASQQFVDMTDELPFYKKTLEDKIRTIKSSQPSGLNKASDAMKELEKEIISTTPGSSLATDSRRPAPGSSKSKPMEVEVVPPSNPLESVETMLGPLATAGVVVIFTIFMLAGREDLRNRFLRLVGGRLSVMTQALDEATRRINRYLLLQLLVNIGYGLVVGTVLYFIGIPSASLWGVSAGALRFLPYAGPPIAALMPIVLSLALFPGWHHALATLGLFVVLEVMVSNFVEPFLYGAHVGLSPLAVLVAAVFWTLIWGFPGLVLATPLTVCLVVGGRYVPSLAFLNILLGDEPVLPPQSHYYQRLLAADQVEARQILEEFSKDHSLEETYSAVVIPALTLAEQDRHRHNLDEETQNFIYQSTRELIEELAVAPPTAEAGADTVSAAPQTLDLPGDRPHVLCIPARDEADDIVATLLCQVLEREGYRTESISIGTTEEMLSYVTEAGPDVVCISALPPFAFNHARALYFKLRARLPKLHVVICVWNYDGDPGKGAARLRIAPGHAFFTTLPQAVQHLQFRFKSTVAPT
jgi:predicted PurR-regulated permease PerM